MVVVVEFYATAVYKPAVSYTGPYPNLPYAGAFGNDGNFYVGGGTLEPSVGSSCNAWPDLTAYSTVFNPGDIPALADLNDGIAYNMGMQFITTVAGNITAVRFYKATSEKGYGHAGKIYEYNTGR